MKNINLWIKRNWWKLLLPMLVPIGLLALWYFKKHSEIKELINTTSEKYHKNGLERNL